MKIVYCDKNDQRKTFSPPYSPINYHLIPLKSIFIDISKVSNYIDFSIILYFFSMALCALAILKLVYWLFIGTIETIFFSICKARKRKYEKVTIRFMKRKKSIFMILQHG